MTVDEKGFFERMLNGKSSTSSKRFIAFLGVISLIIALILNSIFGENFNPADSLVEAIEYIIIACIFGATAEYFGKKDPKEDA